MADKYEIKPLLESYLADELLEEDQLFAKINDPASAEEIKAWVGEKIAAEADIEYAPARFDYLFNNVISVDKPVVRGSVYRFSFLRRWGWAAASILLLITAVTIVLVVSSDRSANSNKSITESTEIAPGKEGAILTLADGSQVSLDSIKNGVVALQGGSTAKIVNGVLRYEGSGNEVVYNTMSTPKGRQFHLTLPDGTQVWLNSASSIRYPTIFSGAERRVEITGEGYFEVAKNKKMPFRLSANNKAEIEVLGTHFNVNAYENEESINTTLIEGSVKVQVGQKTQHGSSDVILKPGQQAQLILVGQQTQPGIAVVKADIEKAIAWKNGLFNFEGATLKEVMKQLERWYDIEVVYENQIPNIRFEGKMARDIPLSGLLTVLERSDVHFRIEGRRLIVLP